MATFDLASHLERQRAFSLKTFGPGARTAGVIDHIRKELREIEADPTDIEEWIVLCTAVLGEPKPGDECALEFGDNAINDSDRDGTFNWGWPLTEVEQMLPPVPARGAQGLWNWAP